MRRAWLTVEQVVLAVVVAVLSAIVTVFEFSLPPTSSRGAPLTQAVYFCGWFALLWLAPLLFLPNPEGGAARIRRSCGILVVAVPMAVLGLLIGFLFQESTMWVGRTVFSWTSVDWSNSEDLWIARPQAVNAICGSYVVVAFASIWWRGLGWTRLRSYTWVLGSVAVATVYSGWWGWFFYKPKVATQLASAFSFGALPVAGAIAVVLAYAIARDGSNDAAIGWPVSRRFWWWLPAAFASVLVVNAWVVLAPLDGVQGSQRVALVVAHAVNGAILGWSLLVTRFCFRWVEEIQSGERIA